MCDVILSKHVSPVDALCTLDGVGGGGVSRERRRRRKCDQARSRGRNGGKLSATNESTRKVGSRRRRMWETETAQHSAAQTDASPN